MTIERFDNLIIGLRSNWGQDSLFGLNREDRRQHVYCIGKSGTGKTTLLRNLILQDIRAGEGVALIDPHGDLAEEILDLIPSHRTDDVVYFDPADLEHPIGWNLISATDERSRHLVASGIVAAFKAIWRDSWGARLEYILYASVAALLECENTTLLGLQRMLTDTGYRRWVLRQVRNPIVSAFWTEEFESWSPRFRVEAISALQNKVGQLLMAAPIRNILGQVKRKVDARFIMDEKRIFIANLSKGSLGDDKSNLLGALLVTSFQQAAMSRRDVPESERRDFYLYIDEFQNFSTDSFASILSEARKYRLCLTLAHQFTEQLRPEIREAVFGNVGTMISFRIGHADATRMAAEFGSGYPEKTFVALDNHCVCVRQICNGHQCEPFLGRTLPPLPLLTGRAEKIRRLSRQKFGLTRERAEGKIARWLLRTNP